MSVEGDIVAMHHRRGHLNVEYVLAQWASRHVAPPPAVKRAGATTGAALRVQLKEVKEGRGLQVSP